MRRKGIVAMKAKMQVMGLHLESASWLNGLCRDSNSTFTHLKMKKNKNKNHPTYTPSVTYAESCPNCGMGTPTSPSAALNGTYALAHHVPPKAYHGCP